MKKGMLYSLLPCLMAMLMCATFTACSDDDDDDPTENVRTEQTETNKENNSSTKPPVTHPIAVDLGLSVKWASCNVGATTPEEMGGYYAWGETEEKEDYTWETYKFRREKYITKYCRNINNNNNGVADNITTLEPCDDVAHVKWGSSWRMPTTEEQDELRKECAWEWTTINNVKGYKITGPNGNSIFIPATYNNPTWEGVYWSSSLGFIDAWARNLFFIYNETYGDFGNTEKEHDGPRFMGCAVRPICE